MKNVLRLLFLTCLLFFTMGFNNIQAQITACEGTIDATTQLNTTGGAGATLIGDGTPGRIRICLTANSMGASSCMGISTRIYIYNSAGTFLTSWPATTTVGTCYTVATCDGYIRMRRWCWTGDATVSFETVDCATGLVNQCTPAHCSNGVMDADETGVDCGGADCPSCLSCTTNEECITATALTSGVTVTGCNVGASNGPAVAGAPLCDMSITPTVWYSFTTGATDVAATITVDNTCFTYPQFAIYTNCSTLLTSSCVIDGNLSGYTPLSPSTTYYLAVSDYLGAECNFDVTVTTYPDNSACLAGYTLVPSATGPYVAGQTVNFTFTITDWNKAACNWLQGIVPDFGPCWDMSTFTSSAPTGGTSTADGHWIWDTNVIYNVNGGQYSVGDNVGPGWFWLNDSDPGYATNDPDAAWGNQGGCNPTCSDCSNSYVWNFSITVLNQCNQGTDCTVRVKTFGDGEVGNWISPGCQGDLPAYLYETADPLLCPLPIELLDFSGQSFEGYNKLNWITATETNTDYFIVETSRDGRIFYYLGDVDAQGNSTQNYKYEFIDNNALAGNTYYRLKQVDLDGNFNYSRMVIVNTKAPIKVTKSYPNPVEDYFNIELALASDQDVTLAITDMSGRMVKSFKYSLNNGDNKLSIPVDGLSKGVYYVSIYNSENSNENAEKIKMAVK